MKDDNFLFSGVFLASSHIQQTSNHHLLEESLISMLADEPELQKKFADRPADCIRNSLGLKNMFFNFREICQALKKTFELALTCFKIAVEDGKKPMEIVRIMAARVLLVSEPTKSMLEAIDLPFSSYFPHLILPKVYHVDLLSPWLQETVLLDEPLSTDDLIITFIGGKRKFELFLQNLPTDAMSAKLEKICYFAAVWI